MGGIGRSLRGSKGEIEILNDAEFEATPNYVEFRATPNYVEFGARRGEDEETSDGGSET
jgi:hypothetical protein